MEKQDHLEVVSDNVTHLVVCASHQAILDKVHTVAAREAASRPTGRAGATATGSERDLTCPPISQWAALEDKTLNIEQPIVINGVEYPFFYDARALMRGINPIVPLVLCHEDQCAEFLFLLSKVNKFVNDKLGERVNLYIIAQGPEVATLDYCQMVFDEMSWLNPPDVSGTDDYAVSWKVFPFLETVFCLWGLQTISSCYSILEMVNESQHNSTSQVTNLTGAAYGFLEEGYNQFAIATMCIIGHAIFHLVNQPYTLEEDIPGLCRAAIHLIGSTWVPMRGPYKYVEDFAMDCLILSGCFSVVQNPYQLSLQKNNIVLPIVWFSCLPVQVRCYWLIAIVVVSHLRRQLDRDAWLQEETEYRIPVRDGFAPEWIVLQQINQTKATPVAITNFCDLEMEEQRQGRQHCQRTK